MRIALLPLLLLVAACSGFLAIAAPDDVSAQQPDVLVVGTTVLAPVKTYLDALGILGTVDTFDHVQGTPTVAAMQAYEVVLLFTVSTPQNSTLLGDNLAAYVDAGGNVVEAQYAHTATWGIDGAWLNYQCLSQDDARLNNNNATKGTVHDTNHPIVQNLNVVNGASGRRDTTAVINGATKIMDWSDNTVCIAVNETQAGRIACINMYPAVAGWDPAASDTDLMYGQALTWAALGGKPKIDQPAAGAMTDGYLTDGYSVTVTHTGGQDPITWSITAGALPPGLNINASDGAITGTPTT
ncbi:MAG: Ig domain-containing protein, partial [Planctomycetota bacterium]